MSKKADPESGRVAYDERGQGAPASAPPAEGFDPYSRDTAGSAAQKPRRTLDDMRKLSEEIKKNRARK